MARLRGDVAEDWEPEIRAFEERDRVHPPPKNGTLFTGSSSIAYWKSLEADFSGVPVINRGFGGAQLRDLLKYAHGVVLPYEPSRVLVYAGSHDLQNGSTPEMVLQDFVAFCRLVHQPLPETRVSYISLKPSIAEWDSIQPDITVNRMVAEYADAAPGVEFIDTHTPMLAESRPPPGKYFATDLNHLSRQGYELWAQIIRPYPT